MKLSNSLPGLILGLAFFIFCFFVIQKSTEEANKFVNEKSKVSEILNFNDRLLSFRDWVFTEQAWKEKKEQYDVAINKAEKHYSVALTYGNYILFGAIILLISIVSIYARTRPIFGLTLGLCFISFALLFQGILNPIIEMGAFKEDLKFKAYVKPKDIPQFNEALAYAEDIDELATYLEYIPVYGAVWSREAKSIVNDAHTLMVDNADVEVGIDKIFMGRTYFYYQNKGVLEVISLLWKNGNRLVSVAIGLFSIIIPLVKLLSTMFILLVSIERSTKAQKFLSFIAKWSMADVFVVATFLAFLSFANMSPGVQMESNVLFGLYFFLGYVIISIILGTLLKWSIREKEKIKSINENRISVDIHIETN